MVSSLFRQFLLCADLAAHLVHALDFTQRDSSVNTSFPADPITSVNRDILGGLIEGDIVPRPAAVAPLGRKVHVLQGGICLEGCYTWPKITPDATSYTIPYEVDASFSAESVHLIEWVLGYIATGSNIRFVPHTIEPYHLYMKNGDGCYSHVGRVVIAGGQDVNLKEDGCVDYGTVLHEVTHALGIDHEHQRPDRTKYINVIYANVRPGYEDQLVIEENIDSGVYTSYDYGSIMHYRRTAFSINLQPVLQPLDAGYDTMLDFNKALYSPCDWHEINILYPGTAPVMPCIPHVVGRGLEPTAVCLARFSQDDCERACTLDSGTFFRNGYCKPIGSHELPPPPTSLAPVVTGMDRDPTGAIRTSIMRMRQIAAGKRSRPCASMVVARQIAAGKRSRPCASMVVATAILFQSFYY